MKASFVIGEKPDGTYEVVQLGGDAEASNQAYKNADSSFVEVAFFRKPAAFKRKYPSRIKTQMETEAALKAVQEAKEKVDKVAEAERVIAENAVIEKRKAGRK